MWPLRRRRMRARLALPLPPLEMRQLVGPTDPALFDNPTGKLVFDDLAPGQFRSVLDFGCGCGRVARQLIQQKPRPERYEGLDLHAGMVRWAEAHLAPHAPGFHFAHHDVAYAPFNPGEGKPVHAPLPFADGTFSLILAFSVFTHLTQDQTSAYLAEMRRVLAPRGLILSTWFLFEKHDFPMMQKEQNTLFINEYDVRNAVIYDRDWLQTATRGLGLSLHHVVPPAVHGGQWELRFCASAGGVAEAVWPADEAPIGRQEPPQMPAEAHRIGL